MKKFLEYFRDFHRSYFDVRLYVFTALFIAVLILFNYTFDFEDSYIDSFYGKVVRMLFFFLYHALAYYGVLLIIQFFGKEKLHLSARFWMKSLAGLMILGFDRGVYPFVSDLLLSDIPHQVYRFYFKVLYNAYGLLTIVLPVGLLMCLFDRHSREGLYGLRLKKVDFKAYGILLLLMMPVLLLATCLPDLLDYYPTYERAGGKSFSVYYDVTEWIAKVVYEMVYLLDFVNTELLFRGLLIIGLSKMLGKNVVLPMVAAYAVLHFGKPLGETISSVFGGYILGIIALYSRNIWGGIFLHGGIALLMEIFASWRK